MNEQLTRLYRSLPSVDHLLAEAEIQREIERYGRTLVVRACREALEAARAQIRREGTVPASLNEMVLAQLDAITAATLLPVINATGVIVHTNLGRAPLSPAALAAMQEAGSGYSNLEFDMASGRRGSRYTHVAALLAELCGAEDALVVNNNAAALVLLLGTLAAGREAIVSRAHLVEIGGGFRIPDIMQQSGALLREVGTTNRTYLEDYTRAVTEETALFLRIHTSNFRIEGFVHQPPLADLAAAARENGLYLVDDVGSGALLDTTQYGMAREPTVQESLAAGADLVVFSGDKLLGGPQGGCIVGRRELVARLRRHPLARALRVDKTTLAALDATLRAYQRGRAETEIPVWQMIARKESDLEATAREWAAGLQQAGLPVRLRKGLSTVGGGSLPGESLPTWLLALDDPRADRWAAVLRDRRPAVIARIEEDHLLIDPRTVLPGQAQQLLDGLIESYRDLQAGNGRRQASSGENSEDDGE